MSYPVASMIPKGRVPCPEVFRVKGGRMASGPLRFTGVPGLCLTQLHLEPLLFRIGINLKPKSLSFTLYLNDNVVQIFWE